MTSTGGLPFRCATASRAIAEPVEGTASTVRSFLLVECPGPWGVEALEDSRLPETVKAGLRGVERSAGIRPLLIRRPGRSSRGACSVFAAYTGSSGAWLQRRLLGDVRELADLSHSTFVAMAGGQPPGWDPWSEPLFAVCTHGRHDACCAERGRPLVTALAAVAPELTWEVSHIGGDRFAANALVLPHGLYYGRLEPGDATRLVAAHRSGRLDLEHLRGRTAYPFGLQAAEIHLRRHLADDRLEPFPVLRHLRAGVETEALFDVDGRRWRVVVTTTRGERRQITCRAAAGSSPPVHRLVSLSPVDERP